jgi:signal transduction histidine kinase
MVLKRDLIRIDLDSASLKDYYYLTLIVGLGLLFSIASFVVVIQIQFNNKQREFQVESALLETGFDLAFSNQIFRLQSLETELHYANFAASSVQPRIDALLGRTVFDRLAFMNMDPTTQDLQKKWIYALDPKRNSVLEYSTVKALREAIGRLGARTSNHLGFFLPTAKGIEFAVVWKFLGSGQDFLVAFAPAQKFFALEALEDKSVVIEQLGFGSSEYFNVGVEAGNIFIRPMSNVEFEDMKLRSPLRYAHELPVLGENTRIFRLKQRAVADIIVWPLVTVLACLTITMLVAFLVFNLINRNIEVNKLVRQKTRDLEAESRKAHDAAMAKTRFLANVSHEVRTPLNLILGMADLLRDTKLSEEQTRYVENFSRAGNHLLRLIGDILDVARLDSNEIKVFPDRVNLLRFFEELVEFVGPSCLIKGLGLHFYLDPHLPSEASFDPSRVRQIVLNLLNNSLKFTDSGSVTIEVRRHVITDTSDRRDGIVISVSDTGIGIAPDQIQNIFREFYQVDSSETRSRGGAGLGLAIVRSLVDWWIDLAAGCRSIQRST